MDGHDYKLYDLSGINKYLLIDNSPEIPWYDFSVWWESYVRDKVHPMLKQDLRNAYLSGFNACAEFNKVLSYSETMYKRDKQTGDN